ncbi:MAG: methyltransferase domain-containing protein [Desulfovibrionaceae bacterium]|nr:methyltransferase domain-containing protein [Desulfovibrionaceae bacterium]
MTTQAYYQRLEEFTALCIDLARAGQTWLAVIVCHELYRFLYPVEPYAGFTHTDPVAFAAEHIERLLASARTFSAALSPYPPPAQQDHPAGSGDLKDQTSEVYSELWERFDDQTLTDEGSKLLLARLPQGVVESHVRGRAVLDLGCGSGRYSIALARAGAGRVLAVDAQRRSFARAEAYCREQGLAVDFKEQDVLALDLENACFDFVFCNGVLHHTADMERGLAEMARLIRPGGAGFLYLYGAGGIFWDTRRALRRVFRHIPQERAMRVLEDINMPPNRFIFCDTWYVPRERHTSRRELEALLNGLGLDYEKVVSKNAFDLDKAIADGLPGAADMWGDGEHRYLLRKKSEAHLAKKRSKS